MSTFFLRSDAELAKLIFAAPMNKARLDTVATYDNQVPTFEKLIKDCGYDRERFFEKVEQIGTEQPPSHRTTRRCMKQRVSSPGRVTLARIVSSPPLVPMICSVTPTLLQPCRFRLHSTTYVTSVMPTGLV